MGGERTFSATEVLTLWPAKAAAYGSPIHLPAALRSPARVFGPPTNA